jgi:two-component system chemotaxis response regulator CheB
MKTVTTPIRVLVVEDSPVVRELLVSILQSAPGMQVVGTARNGAEAVRLAMRLRPDVITMDVNMPEMDGLEAARQIMGAAPCPIVIVSNSFNKRESELTFSALKAGALSVVNKPTMYDPPEALEALVSQVKLMSEVKVIRRWNIAAKSVSKSQGSTPVTALSQNEPSKIQMVVIASSTGGPSVLAEILRHLPAQFPVPILVVQHITSGFGQGLVEWLNRQTPLEVRLARHSDEPQPGQVLFAPDDYHMLVNNLGLIALTKDPPVNGLRPAADYLFNSVAEVYGATALGIVLTGMGSDGARGLRAMRETGAHTIAQNEATCVVFGMPAVAIQLEAAEQILPTGKIAAAVTALVSEI